MKNQTVTQAIVGSQGAFRPHQTVEEIALFNADGTPFTGDSLTKAPLTVAGAIGTAAKTCADPEPAEGSTVLLQFTNGNSANSPTVAFDGGSARAIKLGNTASTGAKLALAADGIAMFYFDGTVLHQIGEYT